jgi:hypothetical protein
MNSARKRPQHIGHHNSSASGHNATHATSAMRKVRARKKADFRKRSSRHVLNPVIENNANGKGDYILSNSDPYDLSSTSLRVSEKKVISIFIKKVNRCAQYSLHVIVTGTDSFSSERPKDNYQEAQNVSEAAAQPNAPRQNCPACNIYQPQLVLRLEQLASKEPEMSLNKEDIYALIHDLHVRFLRLHPRPITIDEKH